MNALYNRATKLAGVAALAVFAAAFAVSPAVSGPFSNGDFAIPPHPGFVNITVGGTIGAWTVTSGSVDHGTAPAQTACPGGGQCVDLNGSSPGMIIQTFDTPLCKPKYRVDFLMSRHKALATTSATLAASINSTNVGGSFTHSAANVWPTGQWEAHTFTFVATSPTTTLSFKSTSPAGGAGPQVGNVSVKLIGCE